MSQTAAKTYTEHFPVMLAEVLEQLNPQDGKTYVDATFGRGGYTRAILEAADCTVIAFDRDADAIVSGQTMIDEFRAKDENGDKKRLTLLHHTFSNLEPALKAIGIESVDGIVFDLGVSSPQLDKAERGFSFSKEGPLDMRMGLAEQSAADVIATMDEKDLADIIYKYGEEKKSRAIAKAICSARDEEPITTTTQLAEIIYTVNKPRAQDKHKNKIDPATRTFQALRIFVNNELGEIESALAQSEEMLAPDGHLVVVSFHSLEDRIVKQFLAERSVTVSSRLLPGEVAPPPASFDLLTGRKPITANTEETDANPRSRSAKLRAAKRTDAPIWGLK